MLLKEILHLIVGILAEIVLFIVKVFFLIFFKVVLHDNQSWIFHSLKQWNKFLV